MGETKKRTGLVDFLYRDLSKIDSIFAQLYQGTIREVATSENISSSISKSVKFNAQIAAGNRSSENTEANTIHKRIDPHDQRILDILNVLNLSPYEDDFSNLANGQIVLIKGNLIIRDYQALSKIIPMLPEIMAFEANSKEKRKIKNEVKPIMEALKLIPFGLEIEIETGNDETIIGSLKREYLEENHNDLLRVYGNNIPGEWYVLGIASLLNSTEKQPTHTSEIRDSLDNFGQAIRSMYTSGEYVISPILIFRELIY